MTFAFSRFFPHENMRPMQEEAIEFILNSFLTDGKRFVVLEAPTGSGKSAIGITVARYLHDLREQGLRLPLWKEMPEAEEPDDLPVGSWFLTTQKTLQAQYMHDFGPPRGEMRSIKSSSNFDCTFHCGQSCGESLRMLRFEQKDSKFWKNCMLNCVYKQEKRAFIESDAGVTNFPYFLAETAYAGGIKPRELLVVDECHNITESLSSFIEVTFSERFAKSTLKLDMPNLKTERQAIKWIQETYLPKLAGHMKHVRSVFQRFQGIEAKLKELKKHAELYERLDKHECKVNRFLKMYSPDNWVMNIIPPEGKSLRKIEFKPVDVAQFSEDYLFRHGQRVLMMSATVLDKEAYCKSIGLTPHKIDFISLDSPFPKENRPIFYLPAGKMSKTEIDSTLPKLVDKVNEILNMHKGESGVIHAQTYKIARYIKQRVKDKRLLLHTPDDREEVLQKHMDPSKPTVLISPSMTEGIDLKDDASRFQIIAKVPFPFLGDTVIRKRMHKHKWWYPYATAKTLVQAYGRSVRHKDDHAVTYILDENFRYFFAKNDRFFPGYFREAIVW